MAKFGVLTLSLNIPAVGFALNSTVVAEITDDDQPKAIWLCIDDRHVNILPLFSSEREIKSVVEYVINNPWTPGFYD